MAKGVRRVVRAARAWPVTWAVLCARGPYCARPVLRAAQHIIGNLLSHRRGTGRHKALLIFMIHVDVV